MVRIPRASLAKSASIARASQRASQQLQSLRQSSTGTSASKDASTTNSAKGQAGQQAQEQKPVIKKKTIAEMDEELRVKLEGLSGDGGASGVEYEGGKAEGLKRNVKANMFRVI